MAYGFCDLCINASENKQHLNEILLKLIDGKCNYSQKIDLISWCWLKIYVQMF